jgi:hypothetical protein
MGEWVRHGLRALLAAALVAASLTGIWAIAPTPVGAAECPIPPASGHWTGTAVSDVTSTTYATDAQLSFHDDGTITGSVFIDSAGPFAVNGTFDCSGNIVFGTVANGATFTGSFSPDGRSDSGTYTAPGDNGTWSGAADPYVLQTTSRVSPTTIVQGAPATWVIEVQNTGGAAATTTEAQFDLVGNGVFDLANSSVSQGTPCEPDSEVSGRVHCTLGTILPGATASATIPIFSNGGPGTSLEADGQAYTFVGGGTDDIAPPVTISVVAPANLPPGTASGVAQPGVKFVTAGGSKATAQNPLVVVFRLPKRVAAGSTTMALSRAAKTGKTRRSIDGISLMSLTKHAPGHHATRPRGSAMGLPKMASVAGPSVPMSIAGSEEEANTFCGGFACTGEMVTMTAFNGYHDRKHPAKLTITWDKAHAGRGLSSRIFKRGDARTSPTTTLGTCVKTKAGYTNTPCVSKKRIVSGGAVQFTMLVLSGDPKFGRR